MVCKCYQWHFIQELQLNIVRFGMQLNSEIKSNEALSRAERLEQIFKTQVATFHTTVIVVDFSVPPSFFR